MKRLAWWWFVAALTTVSLGCGDGFSTEEATATCDEERRALPNCVDTAAYQACISCHESCGDECATVDTACPVRFSCPTE